MKIGILNKDYPTVRNILNKLPAMEYVVLRKNNNLFHSLQTLAKFIHKKLDIEGRFYYYNRPKVDFIHLFNDINYSNKNWATTFETLIPRFKETKNIHQHTTPTHTPNKKTKKGFEQIAKKACKAGIALSNNSFEIQKALTDHYPELSEKVMSKIHILPPPQELMVTESQNISNTIQEISFIFIGNQFHRKGGEQLYNVFEKLKNEYSFRLIIISNYKSDNYVTKVSDKEALSWKEKIQEKNWIESYSNLSNEKVLELIKSTNVGLLPTWSDTYGFSVLEMQACGVPVITTDIRALPEINEDAGWLIKVPKNSLGQGLYFTEEQQLVFKKEIESQLRKIILSIYENPTEINVKSKLSLERIKKVHDPLIHRNALAKIYGV